VTNLFSRQRAPGDKGSQLLLSERSPKQPEFTRDEAVYACGGRPPVNDDNNARKQRTQMSAAELCGTPWRWETSFVRSYC